MSKKQRVKGKGADIFFSEEQEETEELVKKATFYFTQSQLDALEKTVFLLKQAVLFTSRSVHRIKTNKSEVMRQALEEFTSDFLQNRKDSKLYKRLS